MAVVDEKDEATEVALKREIPPDISVVPLRKLPNVSAREALRTWLSRNGDDDKGEEVVEPFEARAYLPPEVLVDRRAASEQLREQLVLEEKFSLSVPTDGDDDDTIESSLPPASKSVDDVYEDVLEVAESHALSRDVGCTVTVGFHRSTTCPMLHVDNVQQRAMCTLLGRGTEWLKPMEDQSAEAAALISAVKAAQDAGDYALAREHKMALEATAAFDRAEERETVLIRGCKWPGVERQAPLHRSPLLPRDGAQFRLVVKVDSGRGIQGLMQRRSLLAQQRQPCRDAACRDTRCKKGSKPIVTADPIGITKLLKTFKFK